MRRFCSILLALVLTPTLLPAQAIDFEREIFPILEARCFECHSDRDAKGRPRKPKADLRLDGKGHILRGGNMKPTILVPGKPQQSPLYQLVALPADDLDIMPPKGSPLTADEIETIRRWIAEGADFGTWKGKGPAFVKPKERSAPPPDAFAPGRVQTLRRIATGVSPVSTSKLEKLAAGPARIEPVIPGSPLLRISFRSRETEVNEALLKSLAPVAGHIAELDLSRTAVSDDDLRAIGKLPRLVRLNLRDTKVTDRGLAALGTLPELRSLVLHGTAVTDASVPALSAQPQLTDLYVWKTEITPDGVTRLRERTGLNVRHAPIFPAPPRETEGRGRRRRG